MKRAYLAIKYHDDMSNKKLIEDISDSLKKAGVSTIVMVRDIEKWGKVSFPFSELMRITFDEIDKADELIIELSEKGVGLGIEAGYAFAKKKPVIVIAKEGSEVSNTLRGIAKEVIFYKEPKELSSKLF